MSAILGTLFMGIVNSDGTHQHFVYQVCTPEVRPVALVG